jgi:periplasmic protein TonB
MVVLYGVSFALHASLGMGVTELEPSKEPERVAITVVDVPKPKAKPKVEEPPPPPPPPPPVEAPKKAAPRAKAAEPPPAAQAAPAAAPTFGIAMTGGVGLGGIAVPVGESLQGSAEPRPKRVAEAKTLVEPKKPSSACDEPASKPKLLGIEPPQYTEEARAAAIEGKVRVEVVIDASGAVKSVKVLEPLGHGLDEAALAAARTASFEPAQQCGKPVSATIAFGIRFAL